MFQGSSFTASTKPAKSASYSEQEYKENPNEIQEAIGSCPGGARRVCAVAAGNGAGYNAIHYHNDDAGSASRSNAEHHHHDDADSTSRPNAEQHNDDD